MTNPSASRRKALVDAPGCHRAGPYSLAVEAANIVFSSGQIGLDAQTGVLVGGGVEAEARQVFQNLKAVAQAAGLTFDHVVKCNAYLTNVSDFSAFNAIYAEQFNEPYPARTTIVVADLPLGAKVEVELVLSRA